MISRRFFASFLLTVALTLTACVPSFSDPLSYQREAAYLLLDGQIDGFSFSAELALAPLGVDAEAKELSADMRDFTLTYTAPNTLDGLTLIRREGIFTLCCGEVTFEVTGEIFLSMFLPATLFCIDCEMGEAAVVEQDGAMLNRIVAADDEGRYWIWLDQEGYPRRIEAVVGARASTVDIQRRANENAHIS